MDNETQSLPEGFEKKFVSFVGKFGVLISILLLPPIFSKLLAVSGFTFGETKILWGFSSALLLLSVAQIMFSSKIKISWSLFFFVIFIFISLELFTRVYVKIFFDEQESQELGMFGNKTHEEFSLFKGHPFLAYTGNPGIEYFDKGIRKKTTPYNSLGFAGKEFSYKKPPGKIRVACIGGSTTERGYPSITEYQLNKHFKDSLKFEVLNFGISGWTSANSLTNYMLNIRAFNPDYVLIHHGWNEGEVRNTPKDLFRSDYSHALSYFHEPEIIDKFPIRISVLYRILKTKFSYAPDWMFLGNATRLKGRPKTSQSYLNVRELIPFKRNINTIIGICLQNNTKVVLSTQPFSLTYDQDDYLGIVQANVVMRNLSQEHKGKLLFLDLDESVTGNMNDVFIDLGHMNNTGTFYKGSEFARVIINDIDSTDTLQTLPPYVVKSVSYHSFLKTNLTQKNKKLALIKKAKQRNLSLGEMIKRDVMYTFRQKNPNGINKPNYQFNYNFQEHTILNNPEWVKTIKAEAKKRKMSYEAHLDGNIKFMLNK